MYIVQGFIFFEVIKKIFEFIEIFNEEEVFFVCMFNRGEVFFNKYVIIVIDEKCIVFFGKDIWRLYDIYGFFVDFMQIMVEERGLKIDQEVFEKVRFEFLEVSKVGGKEKVGVLVKFDVYDLVVLEVNDVVFKIDDFFKYCMYYMVILFMVFIDQFVQIWMILRLVLRVFIMVLSFLILFLSFFLILYLVFCLIELIFMLSQVVKSMILV